MQTGVKYALCSLPIWIDQFARSPRRMISSAAALEATLRDRFQAWTKPQGTTLDFRIAFAAFELVRESYRRTGVQIFISPILRLLGPMPRGILILGVFFISPWRNGPNPCCVRRFVCLLHHEQQHAVTLPLLFARMCNYPP